MSETIPEDVVPEDFDGGVLTEAKEVGEGKQVAQDSVLSSGARAPQSPTFEDDGLDVFQSTGELSWATEGGGSGSDVEAIASKYLGTPYKWGGISPLGLDCSGLTSIVMQELGINLPRTAAAQGQGGQAISNDDLKPGDLVFWDWGASGHRAGADHVAVYIGNGKIIEAPRAGQNVRVANLYGNFWARRYLGN